jgi:formylglycine-generating enzyme required for sulfatase activity
VRDQLPVDTVSWDSAKAFCERVGMRLPTEAEWEWASRGGIAAERYGPLDQIAWYRGNSGGQTHAVRQKLPNPYGLYDMLGNVWEWVADWYAPCHFATIPSRLVVMRVTATMRITTSASDAPEIDYVTAASRRAPRSAQRLAQEGAFATRHCRQPS